MALTRQQKRFTERLMNDNSKLDFIADKQGKARLKDWDKERNALISKRAEVALSCILIGLAFCFLFHG
jgi:hypothetical protein